MWLLQRKLLHPPSINTLPRPVAVSAVNHLSSLAYSLPQCLSHASEDAARLLLPLLQ